MTSVCPPCRLTAGKTVTVSVAACGADTATLIPYLAWSPKPSQDAALPTARLVSAMILTSIKVVYPRKKILAVFCSRAGKQKSKRCNRGIQGLSGETMVLRDFSIGRLAALAAV